MKGLIGTGISKIAIALVLALPLAANAQETNTKNSTITALPKDNLLKSKQYSIIKKSLENDFDKIIQDTITLTEIPAPPFKEEKRAEKFLEMVKEAGLKNAEIDGVGNVIALREGKDNSKLLVVAAHLDTVFPEGTDVKTRTEGNKIYAPGIGDDTVSLGIMLSLVKALDAAKVQTDYGILFVGDVGEEGPGNLRGMRHLFTEGKYKDNLASFISLEPGHAGRVVNVGVGSKRYKIDFKGPGGHSYGDFGIVNPVYAMAEAMTKFGDYPNNFKNKTTYNVGIVEGGTSVNSIPFQVSMTIDMRSDNKEELETIDQHLLKSVQEAVTNENNKRKTTSGEISYKVNVIGERPIGKTDANTKLFKIVDKTYKEFGFSLQTQASSTDSNLPMSLNIPALTLGSGIDGEGAHSPKEYIIIEKDKNLQAIFANAAIIIRAATK